MVKRVCVCALFNDETPSFISMFNGADKFLQIISMYLHLLQKHFLKKNLFIQSNDKKPKMERGEETET